VADVSVGLVVAALGGAVLLGRLAGRFVLPWLTRARRL
jgi:hypothetical protein